MPAKKKPTKEAAVLVVDVSSSMMQGVSPTRLDHALKACYMLIQQKLMFTKQDEIGVVLFGTHNKDNPLDDSGYDNVVVHAPIAKPTLDLLKSIPTIPEEQQCGHVGDLVDALVVAVHMIIERTEKRQYQKRVFLITDAASPVDAPQDLKQVLDKMVELDFSVNVIGLDFTDVDDEESAKVPVDKPQAKIDNEALLHEMVSKVNGQVIACTEAIEIISSLRMKSVLQRPAFSGMLSIGPNVGLPVQGYVKTSTAKFPTMKKLSKPALEADASSSAKVTRDRVYYVASDASKTPLDASEKVKGYYYGKELVPMSQADVDAMHFQDNKGMQLLFFSPMKAIKRHHFMGECYCFVPEEGNGEAEQAVSALIHAMAELDHVAIVRWVKTDKSDHPVLGLMWPHIKPDYECLFFNSLPYSEDLRSYTFEPFGQGDASYEPPTIDQMAAAEELIHAMDLQPVDEDGDVDEQLRVRETFNPVLQHFYQCLHHRAMKPDEPLPQLDPYIASYSRPDEEMLQEAKAQLERFANAFPVKQQVREEQSHKRRYWKDSDQASEVRLLPQGEKDVRSSSSSSSSSAMEVEAQSSKRQKVGHGDDMDEAQLASMTTSTSSSSSSSSSMLKIGDLEKGKADHVSQTTPVEDFEAMLERRDGDFVETAIEQMQALVQSLVERSVKDRMYGKALECLQALRKGCLMNMEAASFNAFLRELKRTFSTGRKSGFWTMVVEAKVSLISSAETDDSDVSAEASAAFLAGDAKDAMEEEQSSAKDTGADADEEDLFGMIE